MYAPPPHLYSSVAVFLLSAAALSVPSGYSIGAILLVLMGVYALSSARYFKTQLSAKDWWLLLAISLFGLGGVFDALYHQAHGSNYDKAIRFLLAAVAFFALKKYPPRLSWLWAGLIIGSLSALATALWQTIGLDIDRAHGYTHPIQFGNLAMLMGFFCLAGLGWAFSLKNKTQAAAWAAALILGAVCAVLSSLLSGSRGGWVSVPFVLLILIKAYHRHFQWRTKLLASLVAVAALVGLYHTPQLNVQPRIYAAINDLQLYKAGDSHTSLGARFEMWQAALWLTKQKPVFGWGKDHMQTAMQDLAAQGKVDSVVGSFNHAHNEFLDIAAKRGLVGLITLILLYLIPIRLYIPYLTHTSLKIRALATAGLILPVAYIDFGLSQAFLSHNSGLMMYAFWTICFWNLLQHSLNNTQPYCNK